MNPFDALKNQLLSCTGCPLHETRTNTVFGEGNPDARVLFIGEAPGATEDELGRPFVGRSGQLLDLLMSTVDLSRESNIFITNMIKCRPPQNRDPSADEMARCIGLLKEQVAIINPAIIVCIGRIAAQALMFPEFKVTQQHGQFFAIDDRLMMGTYHPASLLRNPRQKPDAFGDFLRLRSKIKEVCPEVYETA